MHDGMCHCPHHKVVPTIIVLIGLAFLLTALGVLSVETRDIAWPIGVILIGLMKISGGACSCNAMHK